MVNGLTQAALAVALDLSAPMVSKLKRQGMPVTSVEAARAWRERSLDPLRRKDGGRMPSPPRPRAADSGIDADRLHDILVLARPSIVAQMMVELGLPLAQASIGFSEVVGAIAEASGVE